MLPAEASWTRKLALGAVLSSVGGLGIVLGPHLGASALPWPWSFLAGFAAGIASGLGTVLALAGLLERRHRT